MFVFVPRSKLRLIIACSLMGGGLIFFLWTGCTAYKTFISGREKSIREAFIPSLQPVMPQDGQGGVPLFSELHWVSDQRIADFSITPAIEGRWRIEKGNKAIFTPFKIFPQCQKLTFIARVKSNTGRWSKPAKLSFTTAEWLEQVWVEVDLYGLNTVTVYKGSLPVRTMLASGGTPGAESPMGIFFVQNRGDHFWSDYYREEALYWIRITGEYLFHSVPLNYDGAPKTSEQNRLGGAASHGCIRLSVRDAKWLYQKVPWGAPVIIHK